MLAGGALCQVLRTQGSQFEAAYVGARPSRYGHQLSLADADWPTTSDGQQPFSRRSSTGAFGHYGKLCIKQRIFSSASRRTMFDDGHSGRPPRR